MTDQAAAVWISPGRRSGEPCVYGTRIPTENVATDTFMRDVACALHCYPQITRGQVLVACWFHATQGSRTWRRRWGAWAKQYEGELWKSDWDAVPDPPNVLTADAT